MIGFDTETEVEVNSLTGRPTGAKKKVGLLQLCYRNEDNEKKVLLLRLCKTATIPQRVLELFADSSITFVGNNIHNDMTVLMRDFPELEEAFKMRGGKRKNMVNLSVHARRRDVIQTSSAKLPLLVERVLGLRLPKDTNDTFSKWNQDELTTNQIKYATLDAVAHLLVYEQLMTMADFESRLKKKDIEIDDRVDLAPMTGANKGMMATRAATGIVVDITNCASPEGIMPERCSSGSTSVVIEITEIYAPSFKLPFYRVSATSEKASLEDIGHNCIVVPCSMLRLHDPSQQVRSTPPSNPSSFSRSLPAEETTGQESIQQPINVDPYQDMEDDDLFCSEDGDELTEKDIETLRSVLVFAEEQPNNVKDILKCHGLDDAPNSTIKDVYSAVLGDPWHGMDRPYVPVGHEAKKMYSVAFSEAMFCWNKERLQELESHMRESGMTQDEIEKVMLITALSLT